MKLVYNNGKKETDINLTYKFALDDTIHDIHTKTAISLEKNHNISISSIDEIYLYSTTIITLGTYNVFKQLTRNFESHIKKQDIISFCINFTDIDHSLLKNKETYDFFDILELGFDRPQTFIFPISISHNNYKFCTNPYQVENYNEDILVDTLMNKCLIDFFKPNKNIIYCVLATDLFSSVSNKKQSTFISKTYFPFLFQKDIITLSDNKTKNKNKPNFENDAFMKTYNNTQLLLSKSTITLQNEGIQYLFFKILPKFNISFPLETIFNFLHTSPLYPFIKYNPGYKIENIIKLYTNKKTADGTKIPAINSKKLLNLKYITTGPKKITIFINTPENLQIDYIILEFDQFGNAFISLLTEETKSIQKLTKILHDYLNPLLQIICNYLNNINYVLNLFESFENNDIEIINLTYNLTDKIIDTELKNIQPCLSYIFNISDNTSEKKKLFIDLVYKKISNFSIMNSYELFVQEQLGKTNNITDIIETMTEVFPELESYEETSKVVNDVLQSLELKSDQFENMKLKSVKHPGFPVSFQYNKLTKNLTISISKINNIHYVNLLSSYIKFIFSYLQNNIDESKLKSLCSLQKAKKVEDIKQIEKPIIINSDLNDVLFVKQSETDKKTFDDFSDVGNDDFGDFGDLGDDDFDDFGDFDDDDDNDKEQVGGGSKDLEGVKLHNPTPFFAKMKEREPTLFPIKKDARFNSYSLSCASNYKRQPILLTKDEMNEIKKNHPDSYNYALKYGTNKSKEYYYICPRYWCFANNTSLSRKEVEDGKCGGLDAVIPINAKTIPPGKTIYEFSHPAEHIDNVETTAQIIYFWV